MKKLENKYSSDYELIFVAAILLLFSLWLSGYYQNYQGEQANVFFAKTNNFMADFFNVAKYSVDLNPYNNEINGLAEKAYFPLSYIIMNVFTHFADYANKDAFAAGLSFPSLTITMLFMSFTATMLFIQLYIMKEGSTIRKFVFTVAFMLSGSFMFSFERGNLIILTVLLMSFFINYYESSCTLIKELSFISLAIAAALKGYPAILGLLLIYKKKLNESFRLLIYGIIFVFAPFLLIEGGFSNITLLIRNLKLNTLAYSQISTYHYGIKILIKGIYESMSVSPANVTDIVKSINMVLLALSIICAYLHKAKWKKIGILVVAIIMIPDNSSYYCAMYLFPIIVMYFNEKSYDLADNTCLICFILLLMPYQFGLMINLYIYNISLTLMWIHLIVNGFFTYIQNTRSSKYKIASEFEK